MPSFVRAISLIPKPNFSNAEIIAMCSLPVPETKLTATSVSFIFNFNWSPILLMQDMTFFESSLVSVKKSKSIERRWPN